ncbi:hypothetical protein ANN_27575 [Periplaneta americana]|uniref:Reverse transcriptase zinc-binding domain-containing protein n=1 Tax=Periplaneta americana TaxID=6978 RepID=A0ABQ8RW69_PERAM|nr:hypothetical protein ANN_27575 [Periplaneta americana]
MLAKKGTYINLKTNFKFPYESIKRVIKRISYSEQAKHQNSKWKESFKDPKLIPDLPRKSAVAITGHDSLSKHLHRIGVLNSPKCLLCTREKDMEMEHLANCETLRTFVYLPSKYWEARRMIRQQPAWLSRLRRLPAGLKLRSGADLVPAWADYLVGFFPRFSPTIRIIWSFNTLTPFCSRPNMAPSMSLVSNGQNTAVSKDGCAILHSSVNTPRIYESVTGRNREETQKRYLKMTKEGLWKEKKEEKSKLRLERRREKESKREETSIS